MTQAAESSEALLEEVAARINQIKSRERRGDALNWSRVLAGLRYDKNVVYRILKESDMLEESVVYQDILRKGKQSGLQEGERKGERKGERRGLRKGLVQGKKIMMLHQLTAKVGRLPLKLRRRVEQLAPRQIEALSLALLKFNSRDDLTRWLARHAPVDATRSV